MAIARNRATDAGRRRVHAELVSEPAAAPTGGPGQRLDATRVLTALQALPEAYREPLVLRLVEGLTGPGDRRADRPDPRLGPGQPAPRHEAAARRPRARYPGGE
jgi:hypothetical protein